MPNTKTSVLLTALVLASQGAQAHVLYFNDFQSKANDGHWSSWRTEDTPTPYPSGPRTFLGQFGSESVRFSTHLGGSTGRLLLEFDLYLIRTWDGSSVGTPYDYGNDVFQVTVAGGPLLLRETFSNGNPAGQSFGPNTLDAPMTGAAEHYSLGYAFWDGIQQKTIYQDAVYRLAFEFEHGMPTLAVDFAGLGLQDISDESWGLDNVRLTWLGGTGALAVPSPGVLPLLCLGLLTLVAVRRGRT